MRIPSITFWVNFVSVLAVFGSVVSLNPGLLSGLAPRVQHVVIALALAALWYRSNRNIYVHPPDSLGGFRTKRKRNNHG